VIAEDSRGASALGRTSQSIYTGITLAVNDYPELKWHQNSGGALNVDNVASHFGIAWAGGPAPGKPASPRPGGRGLVALEDRFS
jgi:hypothetical protein